MIYCSICGRDSDLKFMGRAPLHFGGVLSWNEVFSVIFEVITLFTEFSSVSCSY